MKIRVLYMALLLLPRLGHSKVILYGSEYELLTIVYGGPTILRFPTEVKTISRSSNYKIKPANSDEPDYSVLTVEPHFLSSKDKLVFMLNDNSVVKLEFLVIKTALTNSTDVIYDLKDKRVLAASDSNSKPTVSKFELMKALIRGDNISGYEIKNVSKSLSSPLPNLNLELLRVYTGDNYNGYVYKLSNTSSKGEISVDIRKIKLGNPNLAVLANIEDSKILHKKNVFLNIVAKPSSQFGNLIFAQEKDEDVPKIDGVKQ